MVAVVVVKILINSCTVEVVRIEDETKSRVSVVVKILINSCTGEVVRIEGETKSRVSVVV